MRIVKGLHTWIGASFDEDKIQLASKVTILGVLHDLDKSTMEITQSRRVAVGCEIQEILDQGQLEPGRAGKLKGKLQFAAGQLWGKIGRAF